MIRKFLCVRVRVFEEAIPLDIVSMAHGPTHRCLYLTRTLARTSFVVRLKTKELSSLP